MEVTEITKNQIELQYSLFNGAEFLRALESVCDSTYRWETSKRLAKLKKDLQKAAQAAQKSYQDGLAAFEWNVDEKTKQKTPKDPEAIKKYDMEFLEKTFVLNHKPIHINDLNADKVTPNQLLVLEPILAGLDS
jgi:hypothetical protein